MSRGGGACRVSCVPPRWPAGLQPSPDGRHAAAGEPELSQVGHQATETPKAALGGVDNQLQALNIGQVRLSAQLALVAKGRGEGASRVRLGAARVGDGCRH